MAEMNTPDRTRSKIFTPAPSRVGVYVTRWYVRGLVVATWRFYNGPGD
jgi:hypothetical protein